MLSVNPLVSVEIAAYNHENYIQDAIYSIINQSYDNIELIVIDDGSKDRTWQKLQEMEDICKKRFKRVIFQTQENQGTCATLTKLYHLCEGEFVFDIASDDIAKPHTIEKMVDFLSQNSDYALVVGDDELVDYQGKRCYWDEKRNIVYEKENAKWETFGAFLKATRKDVDFSSAQFGSYSSLYNGNYIPNGYLVRASIFKKIGYFTKEAPLEDWWMMLQIAKYAKLKYIDEPLFSYRWHDNNTIKDTAKSQFLTNKTKAYEFKLIKQINLRECHPEVCKFCRKIIWHDRINLFKYIFHKQKEGKKRSFWFLGIKIFEYQKNK